MKKTLFFALLMLALASLACQSVLGTETPAPPPAGNNPAPTDPASNPPDNQPDPGQVAGNLVFEDDFSSENSGWDVAEWENGATRYTDDGRYEISVYTANYDIWANPGLFFDDVRVEVEFTKASGTDINDMGIICRYSEGDGVFSFYYMVVGSDGFVGAYKVVDSQSEVLQELEPGTANIAPEGQVNRLRMDCLGDKLVLFANGDMVLTVRDTSLQSGDVGLIAGVYDEPELTVLFDNFKVYTP